MDKSVEFIIGYTCYMQIALTTQQTTIVGVSTKPKLAVDYKKMYNRIWYR